MFYRILGMIAGVTLILPALVTAGTTADMIPLHEAIMLVSGAVCIGYAVFKNL